MQQMDFTAIIQITPWSALPLFAVLITLTSWYDLKQQKHIPGAYPVRCLLVLAAAWSFIQLLDTLVTDPALKLLAAQLQSIPAVFIPAAWFVFAITFSRQRFSVSPTTLVTLSIAPIVTIGLLFTNHWHQLFWSQVEVVEVSGYVGQRIEPGPWLMGYVVYSQLLIIIATSILAFTLSANRKAFKPVFSVIATPVIASGFNLATTLQWSPLPWIDLTPIGFSLASIVLNHGVLKTGSLDNRLAVRQHVVEQLKDGVMVVGRNGKIVDINPAALALLELQDEDLAHTEARELIKSPALQRLLDEQHGTAEFTHKDRAFHVIATTLEVQERASSEHVLVFREITKRLAAERELRAVKHKLERLAHTDPLTGLFNRRFFMARLEEEVERVRRHGCALSVVTFDLDHFKRINDQYGHQTGDDVLRLVAEQANRTQRLTDVCARIGGEEFAILLPETDAEGALQMAQRLRILIETESSKAACRVPKVTTSVGVATVNKDPQSPDDLMNFADQALYRAKNTGRNKVCATRV